MGDTTPFQATQRKQGALAVTACGISDIGCRRRKNEDSFLLGRKVSRSRDRSTLTLKKWDGGNAVLLAGVFDGISSGGNGDWASRLAAGVFRRLPRKGSREELDCRLPRAFQKANHDIVALRRYIRVSGTTGTVLAVSQNACKIWHLGDSRAYLYRDGQLLQLTRDQTLAQMKLELGIYDKDNPQAKRESHILMNHIGADATGKQMAPAESQWLPLRRGDRLLLCSDGLYGMCASEQIREILQRREGPETAAQALTAAARAQGGLDNITCVIMDIQ